MEDAISILLGDYPHSVLRGRPLVDQPILPEVPAGLPSSLLARRPDIFRAEQNLISANAEIGVAKTAFFSQISLTGSGGATGSTSVLSTLINSNIGIWSVGTIIAQPIFEDGRLRGNLRLAESQQRQQLIAYKQAIQGAFRDVSDALIGYEKHYKVRLAQEVTVKDLRNRWTPPSSVTVAVSPPTLRSSMGSVRCLTPNSFWPKPAATNIRAWCNCTKRSVGDGSNRK